MPKVERRFVLFQGNGRRAAANKVREFDSPNIAAGYAAEEFSDDYTRALLVDKMENLSYRGESTAQGFEWVKIGTITAALGPYADKLMEYPS